MATSDLTLLLLIITFLSFSTPSSTAQKLPFPSNATVYEILPQFGLPPGLLPDSVQSYTFNPDEGSFVVVLPKPCYIQFDYLVYYDDTITGVLKYGSITELKGIQVQRFWIWFGVDEIRVDLPPAESIYFQVGVINKRLDVGQFKEVRSCRDGVALNQLNQPTVTMTTAAEVDVLHTE